MSRAFKNGNDIQKLLNNIVGLRDEMTVKWTMLALTGAMICALVSCASPKQYLLSDSLRHAAALKTHTDQIFISRIDFQQESFADIFADVSRRSKENDPSGRGIRFVIPAEFKDRYEALKKQRFTLKLGPNITMTQFIVEFPMPGWVFFVLSDTDVGVIPEDRFIRDRIAGAAR